MSYASIMDNIPSKLEKYFENNIKFIVYPKQHDTSHHSEHFEHINQGPISKGIETIGKGIETIFRLGKSDD